MVSASIAAKYEDITVDFRQAIRFVHRYTVIKVCPVITMDFNDPYDEGRLRKLGEKWAKEHRETHGDAATHTYAAVMFLRWLSPEDASICACITEPSYMSVGDRVEEVIL